MEERGTSGVVGERKEDSLVAIKLFCNKSDHRRRLLLLMMTVIIIITITIRC